MLYIQAINVFVKLVFLYGTLNIILLLMKEACVRSSLFFVPYKRLANSSDRYTGNFSWSKPETTVRELIIRTGPVNQPNKCFLSRVSIYSTVSFVPYTYYRIGDIVCRRIRSLNSSSVFCSRTSGNDC